MSLKCHTAMLDMQMGELTHCNHFGTRYGRTAFTPNYMEFIASSFYENLLQPVIINIKNNFFPARSGLFAYYEKPK